MTVNENKRLVVMGAILQGDSIKEQAVEETLNDGFVSDISDFVSDPTSMFLSFSMMDENERETAIEDIIRMGIDNYIKKVGDLVSSIFPEDESEDTIDDLPFL